MTKRNFNEIVHPNKNITMKKYFIAQEVFFSTQKASLSFKRKKNRKKKSWGVFEQLEN